MNKLQKYFHDNYNLNISSKINDIGTNLDGSKSNQVIFYRLKNGSESQFLDRVKEGSPGLLILNKNIPDNIRINHLVISDNLFEKAQSEILEVAFPIQQKPKIIGVTGTNGKTSVCFFGMQLAAQKSLKSIFVGTIGVYDISGKLKTEHRTTTPSYIEFHKIIYSFKPEVVFVELSSHALEQKRLKSIQLDAAGWTNFSQDHLDYHKSMDNYFKSKLEIVNVLKDKCFVHINDSEVGLAKMLDLKGIYFSKCNDIVAPEGNIILGVSYNVKNISLMHYFMLK